MTEATQILSSLKNQEMDKATLTLMRSFGQALIYANATSEGGEAALTIKGRGGKTVTVTRDAAGFLMISAGGEPVTFAHPKLVDGTLVAADGSSALVWLSKLVVTTLGDDARV